LQLYSAHGFSQQSYWTTPDGISMVTLIRRGDTSRQPSNKGIERTA